MFVKLFKSHPETVGETYTQHMGSAFSFGSRMMFAGMACTIHGLFPFLFKATGKNAILELHQRMVTHRHRDPAKHNKVGQIDEVAS